MLSTTEVSDILSTLVTQIQNIFSDNLKSVILFGSYARGEQDEGSDIDIMIIVDIDKIKIKNYREKIVELVSELELNYNIFISPIIQNYDEFEKYKDASGFFKSVIKEGVKISA